MVQKREILCREKQGKERSKSKSKKHEGKQQHHDVVLIAWCDVWHEVGSGMKPTTYGMVAIKGAAARSASN